jgi:hypothetical protein
LNSILFLVCAPNVNDQTPNIEQKEDEEEDEEEEEEAEPSAQRAKVGLPRM